MTKKQYNKEIKYKYWEQMLLHLAGNKLKYYI